MPVPHEGQQPLLDRRARFDAGRASLSANAICARISQGVMTSGTFSDSKSSDGRELGSGGTKRRLPVPAHAGMRARPGHELPEADPADGVGHQMDPRQRVIVDDVVHPPGVEEPALAGAHVDLWHRRR